MVICDSKRCLGFSIFSRKVHPSGNFDAGLFPAGKEKEEEDKEEKVISLKIF